MLLLIKKISSHDFSSAECEQLRDKNILIGNLDEDTFSAFDGQEFAEEQMALYDWSQSAAPLCDLLQAENLTVRAVLIPFFLRHVLRAIINIHPLDRYLAAHYERQLTAILVKLSDDEQDLLNKLALTENFDLTGNDHVDAFLRFQRKLYLTYQRED